MLGTVPSTQTQVSPYEDVLPSDVLQFLVDDIELYGKHGYNIYTDENCVAWIQKFHPGFALSVAESFTSVPPMNKINSGHQSGECSS